MPRLRKTLILNSENRNMTVLRRLKTITLIINFKAVVFPIVFSINSAYKRRESALDD